MNTDTSRSIFAVFDDPYEDNLREYILRDTTTLFGRICEWYTTDFRGMTSEPRRLHFQFPLRPAAIEGNYRNFWKTWMASFQYCTNSKTLRIRILKSCRFQHWRLWCLMVRPIIKHRARRFIENQRKTLVKTLDEQLIPVPVLAEICASYLTQNTTTSTTGKNS